LTQTPLTSRDFAEFTRWYAARRQRSKGRPASPYTLRSKAVHLAALGNKVDAESPEFLATLLKSRQEVDAILDTLALSMTNGAQRVAVYALLDFADYARSKGWVDEPAIYKSDIPPKSPDKPITVYSEAELETFIAAARGADLRWWAFLTFLVDTGRRVGETLSLRWDWFRLEAPKPYIELPYQKNGNAQYIPLGPRLREEVFTPENVERLKEGRQTLRQSPKEFPFPFSYGTAYGRFGRFCEKTGLPNRGFHNFRHTYVTDQLVAGVPLQAVSALVGHANPGVTQTRYNHVTALSFERYAK